ncbi:amidase [Rhodovulum sp. DZ06]|uniref:amidase n=1 Tax=Rhodovulum sp. DZ06 TaxID=3425126 RepID=UPI003D35032D
MTDAAAPRHDHPAAAEPAPALPAPVATPACLALSAAEQQAAMARGALTAEALMEATLAQVAALNPTFNAIIALRPREELLAEARAADAARAAGRRPGPLHGLPIAIKDLTNAQGLPTSMGSPLMDGTGPAAADGLMVSRLRAAGAIVIGKTNTPEFGLGSHSFNPVHGCTRNAFDPSRSAGGSSGGAAVALALRMVSIADGSDMMGSLRNPAGWNGIWGMRPSLGRVPDDGAPELFLHQLATNGPMARTVADLATILEVQSGPAPCAPLSLPAMAPGLAARVADGSLEGVRIGWLGDWGGRLPVAPDMAALLDGARAHLAALGAVVEDVALDVDPEAVWQSWLDLRAWAVAAKLAPVMADPARRKLLKPEAVWEAERGAALSALDIDRAANARSDLHRALCAAEATFDALALPAAQLFPFPAEWRFPPEIAGRGMDTYHRWMECVIPCSLSGRPAVSMPAGLSEDGLPGGLQLIGRFQGDEDLLRIAAAWERGMPEAARALPPVLAPVPGA